jgi:hypothetical protein
VWLDRNEIKPGSLWKSAIKDAIREGAFFIACFSREYHRRPKTYMNEELTLAIEELRQRPTDRAWFIPVLLPGGEVPDRNIWAGETLRSIQWVSLSEEDWATGIQRIILVVKNELAAGANADSMEATQLNQQPVTLRAPRWHRWMGSAAISAVLLSSTLNGVLTLWLPASLTAPVTMGVGVSQVVWLGLQEVGRKLEETLGVNVKVEHIDSSQLVRTLEGKIVAGRMPWDLISVDNDALGMLVQKGLLKELPQDPFSSPGS